MRIKPLMLAGVAIAALGFAATAEARTKNTRTKAEEDAITRQLNLDQLAKAQDRVNTATERQTAPDMQDGQGGPEFQGPPGPNEGMTDDDIDDTMTPLSPTTTPRDTTQPNTTTPPEDMPAPPPSSSPY